MENTWKYLNEYGIYTHEQLEKAINETQLDIGIFTTPYKIGEKERKKLLGK